MISLLFLFLFIFGAVFGSFASVLVHRFKTGEGGIMNGRSHCGNCGHTLNTLDLFPLFSWIFSRGKCRYCHAKVSAIYPLLELAMGAVFLISWAIFCSPEVLLAGNIGEWTKLIFWLFVGFVSVVITFYDIAYMEIPDGFLLSSIGIVIALSLTIPNSPIFSHYQTIDGWSVFQNGLLGAFGIYTFFYVLFMIPFVGYFIRKRKWKDLLALLGYYVYLLPEAIYVSITQKQDTPSDSEEEEDMPAGWIGLGDLRIAVFMGFVAGAKIAGIALFLSYLVGSLISVGILLLSRKAGGRHEVPFGPFLIAGLYLALCFYNPIVALIFPSL